MTTTNRIPSPLLLSLQQHASTKPAPRDLHHEDERFADRAEQVHRGRKPRDQRQEDRRGHWRNR